MASGWESGTVGVCDDVQIEWFVDAAKGCGSNKHAGRSAKRASSPMPRTDEEGGMPTLRHTRITTCCQRVCRALLEIAPDRV